MVLGLSRDQGTAGGPQVGVSWGQGGPGVLRDQTGWAQQVWGARGVQWGHREGPGARQVPISSSGDPVGLVGVTGALMGGPIPGNNSCLCKHRVMRFLWEYIVSILI